MHLGKVFVVGCLSLLWLLTGGAFAVEALIAPKAGNEGGIVRYIPDDQFGVDFADAQHGWVSGYYGSILHTDDSGRSWAVSSVGNTDLIRRVDFVNARTGWAVGHRGGILVTRDGGVNWAVQHNEPGTNMRDVTFADEQNGWAVGHNQTILRTADAGATWSRQEFAWAGIDPPRISGIAAYNSMEAIAVGEFGLIVTTADGGATWTLVESPTKGTYTSVAVASGYAIAVGIDGIAVTVPRGGAAAAAITTNTKLHMLDIAMDNAGNGFAVGLGSAYRINAGLIEPVKLEVAAGAEFTWLGGVGLLPDGGAVAVGSRGLIVTWDPARTAFVQSVTWQ